MKRLPGYAALSSRSLTTVSRFKVRTSALANARFTSDTTFFAPFWASLWGMSGTAGEGGAS
jgi:hypothetical protein